MVCLRVQPARDTCEYILLVPKEVPRTVGKSENTGTMATGGNEEFDCAYSDSEPEQRFVRSVLWFSWDTMELDSFRGHALLCNTVRRRVTTSLGRRL